MGIAAYGRGARGKFTRQCSCCVLFSGAIFVGEKRHMHSVDGRPRPSNAPPGSMPVRPHQPLADSRIISTPHIFGRRAAERSAEDALLMIATEERFSVANFQHMKV